VRCPSCNAEVEEGADLCLDCGEPMGDSPAAKVARAEKDPSASPGAASPGAASPAAPTRPAIPAALVSTLRGKRSARPREEEREPIRCPGCGTPSTAARCPGCGIPLRADE